MAEVGSVLFTGYLFLLGGTVGLVVLLLVRCFGAEFGRRMRADWLRLFSPLGLVAGLLYLTAVITLGAALFGSDAGLGSAVASASLPYLWLLVYLVAFLGATAENQLSGKPAASGMSGGGRHTLKMISGGAPEPANKVA